ncbi:binary toxin-like calcium binding domain-containing protein [Frigoribacterium sp. PvP032]|uniref:binary toxin-like calcium binding domain-containing protein n=1 Tax=Frigoribacterium sp. PvP032 TaxID=2806589 RepID=UPI001AE6FB7B|nr:binary toxin-like calcium binding domain-containing protein [Frigoribacterium sp. PvP032]MBP1189920.1 hypothetical protein [Frigoribacterium sp. PvP032]
MKTASAFLSVLFAATTIVSSTPAAAVDSAPPPGPEHEAASAAAVLDAPVVLQTADDGTRPLSVQFADREFSIRPGAEGIRILATYTWWEDFAEPVEVDLDTYHAGGRTLVDGQPGPAVFAPGQSRQIDMTIPGTFDEIPDLHVYIKGHGIAQLAPDRLRAPTIDSVGRGVTCGERPGDADGDLIPDELEREGFAIVGNSLVPWDDALGDEGRKRLTSDPAACRTAHDPYTDFEKATGAIPASGPTASRDPMVASAPVVTVGMEKMMVTPTTVSSEGTTTTRSFTTSKSTSLTLGGKGGWEGGGEMSETGGKVSGKSSAEFSGSFSRSHSITDGSSTTWSTLITDTYNRAAELNGNVRYHNVGTAPIYDAHPTTNWVVDDESIATFRAGPNFQADALNAGDTYPRAGSTALSLETINDAGTVALTISTDELTRIRNGTQVTLETLQTSGNYGAYRPDGSLDTAAGAWGGVLAAVRATSGTLVLDASEETAERYVAAADPRDPDSSTPALSIGESIKRAFDVSVHGNEWTYRSHVPGDPSSSRPIRVDSDAVMLTTDEPTRAIIDAYRAEHPGAGIYDVPLRPGMNIGIKPATEHHDFDSSSDGWQGEHMDAGYVRSTIQTISGLVTGRLYGVRTRMSGRADEAGAGHRRIMSVVGDGLVLTQADMDLPEEETWEDTYVEFTAAGDEVDIYGSYSIDEFSLFDYGTADQADVEWTSRPDDDVRVTDSRTPFEVPVSWLDTEGSGDLTLALSRNGGDLDLSNPRNIVFTTGGSLGSWTSTTAERGRGLVRRELLEEGDSTMFVFTETADEMGYDLVAIVPVTVGPEKRAEIAFWGSGGTRYCTVRFPALETPAFSGELLRTITMPETGTTGRCPNDEIYDAEFTNMPVGTELSVFDPPSGDRKDDFVVWQNTRETTGRLRLDPRSTAVDGVKVIERNDHNGLLGKVSRAVVQYPGAPTAGP